MGCSFPKLPPLDFNPVQRALGGSDGDTPKTPETPANVPTVVPRAPRKRFQTIGKRHRYQIVKLTFGERNPLARQAVLNCEVSVLVELIEQRLSTHHAEQPYQ